MQEKVNKIYNGNNLDVLKNFEDNSCVEVFCPTMGIATINVENSGVLKAQTAEAHPHLNIIKGANGSGKTIFLRNLVAKYHKKYSIRSLLASVQHFKSFPQIEKYENTSSIGPTVCRQFVNEYKTITQLTDNPALIKDCNNFFEQLKIPTRLSTSAETGWLTFSNPKHISKKTIPLEEISPGERTAFVLWLLTKSEKKPDILILDEFDAHLSFMENSVYEGEKISIIKMMYIHIVNHFVKNGVQVFMSTNRRVPSLSNCGFGKNSTYKELTIKDGIISGEIINI